MIKLQGLPDNWYWNSANDIVSEGFLQQRYLPHQLFLSGVWRQYDGELILWSPWWAEKNPYGGTGRNCGRVALSVGEYAGQWASEPCSSAHYYICERDK